MSNKMSTEVVLGSMVGNALGAPSQKKEPVLLSRELAACRLDHCQLLIVFHLFPSIFVSRLLAFGAESLFFHFVPKR